MYTEHDERRGLVKTNWQGVRDRVAKVAPEFAALIDEVSPGDELPLFFAYYSYGKSIGDTRNPTLPNIDGSEYQLTAEEAPKEVFEHLGYGSDSAPFTMILEKACEFYSDLTDTEITSPKTIYRAGDFFPLSRFFTNHGRQYAPNCILTGVSGARSVFLLPKIGCKEHHSHLQEAFNIKSPPAKSLYQHWELFSELANNEIVNSDWKSCLLFFSEKFFNRILNDRVWLPIKNYILQYGWNKTDYDRNQFYYEIVLSTIQQKRNLKPNPFIFDAAKHAIKIALGASPGFEPLTDNELLPLETLQTIFKNIYGLKGQAPTIMGPKKFTFEKSHYPTYYSLQYTSPDVFSPTSRTTTSTLFEVRELAHIINVFQEELARENSLCDNTILQKLMENIEFSYFHNREDQHKVMQSSKLLGNFDERFTQTSTTALNKTDKLASDAKFFRGCVAIKTKGNENVH